MFHFYDGYHFFGMHMVWWFFWILFIGIVFGAYEPVRRNRGQRIAEVTPQCPDRPLLVRQHQPSPAPRLEENSRARSNQESS